VVLDAVRHWNRRGRGQQHVLRKRPSDAAGQKDTGACTSTRARVNSTTPAIV
jgi:hypothetical protein